MKIKNILPIAIMEKIKKDPAVLAVLVFGSYARKENNRDIDICLVLNKKYENKEYSHIKLKYASLLSEKYDIHLFQQLPLYIRKRILAEGKIIYCRNIESLYNIAFGTIKEFEFYKKGYDLYLAEVEKNEA